MSDEMTLAERQETMRVGFQKMMERIDRLAEARRKAWSPGDIALVQCSDGNWRTAMCEPHANRADELVWRFPDRVYRDVESSVARPLAVLDPEDRGQIEMLLVNWPGPSLRPAGDVDDMQICLARWVSDISIDEPLGIGAVVEDVRGRQYVRTGDGWLPATTQGPFRNTIAWAQVRAIRVLAEGVSA